MQFWENILYDGDSDDYQLFLNSSFSLENHKVMLDEIKNKITETDDELTKKSLLLTSMIFSEILLKSLITQGIPNTSEIDDINGKILKKSINKKLRSGIDELRGFFKEVYGITSPDINWAVLRNSLTHDFNYCNIIHNDTVTFKNLANQEIENFSIESIFKEQSTFNFALSTIVNKKSH